jgi:phage terminase Nu1 subunit (DNA packaging protein)
VTKKAVAFILDIDERRVEQLAQKKIIPKVSKGLFDLIPTIQSYIRYLRAFKGGEGGDLEMRLLQAQAREREAKAELSQLELERRQGELIKVEDVRRQWSSRLIEFKAAMLELPTRAAFRFTDADIRIYVEEELNSFVVETLSRYSRGGIRALGGGDDEGNPQAPDADNGQPVGGRKQSAKRKGKPAAGAVEDGQDAVPPRADGQLQGAARQ